MPQCVKICDALEEFSEVKQSFSEQHVELRSSRQQRDRKDLNCLLEWLNLHSPFGDRSDSLTSLSTGIMATRDINCDVLILILKWQFFHQQVIRQTIICKGFIFKFRNGCETF